MVLVERGEGSGNLVPTSGHSLPYRGLNLGPFGYPPLCTVPPTLGFGPLVCVEESGKVFRPVAIYVRNKAFGDELS